LQGDASTQGVAHYVGPCETEVLDQSTDIVSHRLESQWTVDVHRAPVGLQVGGYDLPALREQRQDLAEHLDRADAAVEQDQWFSGTVDLVVHLEAVHVGIVAFMLSQ
jgi:hypothetical protein